MIGVEATIQFDEGSRIMKHKVTVSVPNREVFKTDIEFLVRQDGQVLGKLLVSKGNVVWRPRNKRQGNKLRWDKFDELMKEHGTAE